MFFMPTQPNAHTQNNYCPIPWKFFFLPGFKFFFFSLFGARIAYSKGILRVGKNPHMLFFAPQAKELSWPGRHSSSLCALARFEGENEEKEQGSF